MAEGEQVNVTFTNNKCQNTNAGIDKLVCAGDPVILEGNAYCFASVEWTIDSSCSGTLEWPFESYDNKSKYTAGVETSCKLYFNATGACPDEYSDDVTVYVVPQPDAEIKLV